MRIPKIFRRNTEKKIAFNLDSLLNCKQFPIQYGKEQIEVFITSISYESTQWDPTYSKQITITLVESHNHDN